MREESKKIHQNTNLIEFVDSKEQNKKIGSNEIEKTEDKHEKIKSDTKEIVSNYIKQTNEKINQSVEKINIIDSKVKCADSYNVLYFYQRELTYIQEQLELIKTEYQNINEEYRFNYEFDFDKYQLSKNDDAIKQILYKIKNEFNLIELKKKELYDKQVIKKETKKETTRSKKQVKQEVKTMTEIEITNQIIIYNIMNQERFFQEYCNILNQSINKKSVLFDYLHFFVNSIFKFDFLIFPFHRNLNLFVGNIIVNNSLRTMRRMINPKLNMNYQFFEEKYYENKNFLLESYKICCDSLEQLDMLELDLKFLDKNDEIYLKLIDLKEKLIQQKESLKQKNHIIDKLYMKIYRG